MEKATSDGPINLTQGNLTLDAIPVEAWCTDDFLLTNICFGVNFGFLVIHLVTLICFKKVGFEPFL